MYPVASIYILTMFGSLSVIKLLHVKDRYLTLGLESQVFGRSRIDRPLSFETKLGRRHSEASGVALFVFPRFLLKFLADYCFWC